MIAGRRVIQPNKPHILLERLKKMIWRDNLPDGVEMQLTSSVVGLHFFNDTFKMS